MTQHAFANSPPKVVVGLDLKGRSQGALAWLAALRDQCQPAIAPKAVHALPHWRSHLLASVMGEDKLKARLLERLTQDCEDSAPGLIEHIELLQEEELSESLEFYAQRQNADLLVLGRVAPKSPTPFVRLGSVARSVLQSLLLPTVVVPCDYEREDFAPGPVMVAVDGTDTSNAALAFALDWSSYLGRELFLAHVLPSDSFLGQDWLPDDELKKAQALLQAQGQSDLEIWLRSQGQSKARIELAQGQTFAELRYLATHHEACMIIAGSRCLHGSERIFNTSMSSALAANCDRPVLVVPSTPWLDQPG